MMRKELLGRLDALGSHLDDERLARSNNAPSLTIGTSNAPGPSEQHRRPVVFAAAAVLVVASVGALAVLLERSDAPPESTAGDVPVVSSIDEAATEPSNAQSGSGSLIFAPATGFEPVLFDYAVSGRGNGPVVISSVDDSQVCVTIEVGDGVSDGCYDAPIVATGLAYGVLGDHGRYLATGVVPDQVDTVTVGGVPVPIVGNVWFVELDSAAPAELRVGDSRSGNFAVLPPATLSSAPDNITTTTISTTEQPVLLLPAGEIEPTYVQHNAAMPHRSRGLVSAPDGSTLSVNLFENFWGELPAEMEQRDLSGSTWATTLEDTNRGYVTLDACMMLSLNAGPNGTAWDANAVALMNSVNFADTISIDLPEGWQLIELDTVGDWYSMSFDPEIAGIPGVTLTQMPESNAGPLLADLAGRPITAITINGKPAWQVPLPEDGWTQTIWQTDTGSMMLTAKDLSPEGITQFLTQLAPADPSDWDLRYKDQDVGADVAMPIPTCEETANLNIIDPAT